MTLGGPAGEGGYRDTPTAPLPVGAPLGAPAPAAVQEPPRRRMPRWLRRVLITFLALAIAGTLAFATLLIATPPVANAPQLARAIDRAHGAAFPGPPVPERFAAALVATEDHRFYAEPGVDPFAIGRVVVGQATGQPDQGGATLYQQLAKMLYTPAQSGVLTELEQVALGVKLDLSYSKAQVMRMYASVAYFGHGYYGLGAASCGYFGVIPARLSWSQAALLAGLVQAPSADNPIAHFAVARAREAHVLDRLAATGVLTQAQVSRAYAERLHLVGGAGTGCTR